MQEPKNADGFQHSNLRVNMAKQVTVNIFDIDWDKKGQAQKFSETLLEFGTLKLDQRWRDDIRLEFVKEDEILGFKVIKLDFVKKREVGPGRMANASPIQGVQMGRDENFGEETAALYVPKKQWLLVLHNQSGVGPTRITSYCNAIDPGNSERHFNYKATAKLDAEAMKKLKSMNGIRSISVTATMDALTEAEREAGTSLAAASRPAKPARINFELHANPSHKRGKFLAFPVAMNLINGLRRRGEDVTRLQVTGESDEIGGKDMMIDLLHHKIKRKFSESELSVVDHRYTRQSRLELLDRAFRGWHKSL